MAWPPRNTGRYTEFLNLLSSFFFFVQEFSGFYPSNVGNISVKNGAKLLNLRSRILNQNKVDKRFRNLGYCPVVR